MSESVLVSFDIRNLFLTIDSKMGINSVKTLLDEKVCKDPPIYSVTESLELQ